MGKMEGINREANKSITMSYYLKKCWKENTLVILCLVILCGLQVGANMLMMQSFQGIIDRNMYRFMFWTLILVVVWFFIYGLTGVETLFQCRVIRNMNNAIRQDIAEILLTKSYRSFHEQSVGEYLSQFTNDTSQIENLAWNPFFDCIRSAVTVVFSIVALLTLHWSLLAASIVTTVIMLYVPKLFHQKMEHLGTVCTQKQATAVSQLKELLTGYDVLRFFDQERRFIRNAKQASDQIEKPKFRLAYVKGFVSAGMGCVNIVCQMLHVILIGILSVRGIILQGALTGGGNLCGNLSAGLSNMTQDVFLFNDTLLNNMTLGGEFPKERIEEALRDSALENDILSLPDGLNTIVGENGSNLSGGQKQRVAIARALIHNRSVLLVDEGTSALDQENADRIENNLLSKPGLTLILVSHHLSAEQKKGFRKCLLCQGDSTVNHNSNIRFSKVNTNVVTFFL